MTLDELLNTEQFDFLISFAEPTFFVNKASQAEDFRIIFQSDLATYYMTNEVPVLDFRCFNKNNSDTLMTAVQGNIMKNIISLNPEKVNPNLLALYFGSISQKYLKWIQDAEAGKHVGRDEICYNDGEIIVVDNNTITTNRDDHSIQDIKTRLAEGILIASTQFQNTKRAINRTGLYHGRGLNNATTRETFDSEKLKKVAKSREVISSLDKTKFADYVRSGLIKKWDILKFADREILPTDIAIDLMIEGIFTPQDIYKALKIRSDHDLSTCYKIGFLSKLKLYSSGKMSIEEMEKSSKFEEKRDALYLSEDDVKQVSKYYKGNINKISELLTHNVLDFSLSMRFLDGLVREECITSSEKDYLVNIMNDFKTTELLNGTQNQRFESIGERTFGPRVRANGVTIDPNLRKQYFASIGNVKEVFINGERFISDESDGVTERNSLDGYQLIIIPDKKIAVLEKFYEVTRTEDGKLEYKRDKNGNYIAATEQATYIMPIAMAKDFAEKKNKQELMKSPYVARTLHSMNWVKNTEDAMVKVANRSGLDIEFEKENTDRWAKRVTENYKKLKEKRMQDIDELI